MKAKLRYLWVLLRSSFWFIPLIIVLLAIGAAYGLIYLDTRVGLSFEGPAAYIFSGSADSARSILSTIAGAMIGVAGTVFSMTLVALTLASSQFGPRLLRNFMYDRINQIVLGTYVSSFVFCLIVLRTVKSVNDIDFVPNLSVLFAILVAVANIFLLIVFIHNIAIDIQADKIVTDVGVSITKSIESLYPDRLGARDQWQDIDIDDFRSQVPAVASVEARKSGYLQGVNTESLMRIATENNIVMILSHRPGKYIVKGEVIVELRSHEHCDDKLINKIGGIFIIGKARTSIQDAEFAVDQMVEIAAKALSPGVNDPFTAISCVNQLTSTLCQLTRVHFPSSQRFDDEGELRIIAPGLTFSGMINAAFNQIRQFATDTPAVLIRMMEALVTIDGFTTNAEQMAEVKRHAEMVMRAGEEGMWERHDLNDLKMRYAHFQSPQ